MNEVLGHTDFFSVSKEALEQAKRDRHDRELLLRDKIAKIQESIKEDERIRELKDKIEENHRRLAENTIKHPSYYGGRSDPYEAIKVIEAWGLNFNLGQVLKYIKRAGSKAGNSRVDDLRKAAWYLDREIQRDDGTLPLPFQKGNAGDILCQTSSGDKYWSNDAQLVGKI